jgi:hypothetical protein
MGARERRFSVICRRDVGDNHELDRKLGKIENPKKEREMAKNLEKINSSTEPLWASKGFFKLLQ